MFMRYLLPLAALLAAFAVGLGAYAAHGLEDRLQSAGHEADLSQRLDWFATGVRYHMYHALGLALVGVLAQRESSSKLLPAVAIACVLGILLFSGSLYAMTLGPDSWRWLGAVVPLGGISLIGGWLILAWTTWNT